MNLAAPLLAALTLLLLTGSARAAEPYRVGFNNWIGFIAFFAAQENGAFKAAGLDVEAKSFSAPGEGIIPLLAGELDAHLTTLDAVILKAASAPGSLEIAGLIDTSSGADAVIAAKEIKTIAGLKGRKVAVTIGECNEVLLGLALESAGLTESDITLVNMDPDAAGAALQAGSVDAAVTWEPWITQLSGGGARVLYSTVNVQNLLLDCVAIRKDSPKKEATRKFLAVLDKTTQWVKAHPGEAAALVSAKLEVPAPEIEDMLAKVTLYDAAQSREQMSGPVQQAARKLAAFFRKKGSITSDVDIGALITTTTHLP